MDLCDPKVGILFDKHAKDRKTWDYLENACIELGGESVANICEKLPLEDKKQSEYYVSQLPLHLEAVKWLCNKLEVEDLNSPAFVSRDRIENLQSCELRDKVAKIFAIQVQNTEDSLKAKVGIVKQAVEKWNGAEFKAGKREKKSLGNEKRIDTTPFILEPKIKASLLRPKIFRQ